MQRHARSEHLDKSAVGACFYLKSMVESILVDMGQHIAWVPESENFIVYVFIVY